MGFTLSLSSVIGGICVIHVEIFLVYIRGFVGSVESSILTLHRKAELKESIQI